MRFARPMPAPVPSRFDLLHAELLCLRGRIAAAIVWPTVVGVLMAVLVADAGAARLWAALIAGIALPMLLRIALAALVPTFAVWVQRAAVIDAEIARLKAAMDSIHGQFQGRRKGQQFKDAYALRGCGVAALERALAIGMFRERREVFVTAFMSAGIAVRVTASIGSAFRCSAADNPARWRDHMVRLGCDEIRQYHNHPEHSGVTAPSSADARSTAQLMRLLGDRQHCLRSFILCWNGLREWRIFAYDATGQCRLESAFDVATEKQPAGSAATIARP